MEILILTGKFGMGHWSAALSIQEQLEREGADPAQMRRAMQVAIKPGENGLSYQTRVLLYSYASDLIAAAEVRGISLNFQPDSAPQAAQAVGSAYEANRAVRGLEHEDNLVLISKELGSYLTLTLCHSMGGKIKVQSVPAQQTKGLSALLVSGIMIRVALPGGQALNPIEVANKVVRSIRVGEDGLTLNQRPILRLLERGRA